MQGALVVSPASRKHALGILWATARMVVCKPVARRCISSPLHTNVGSPCDQWPDLALWTRDDGGDAHHDTTRPDALCPRRNQNSPDLQACYVTGTSPSQGWCLAACSLWRGLTHSRVETTARHGKSHNMGGDGQCKAGSACMRIMLMAQIFAPVRAKACEQLIDKASCEIVLVMRHVSVSS